MTAPIALFVDGTEYSGWKSLRVTRGLTRASADFDLSVSERWGLLGGAWQIQPGAKCEVRYGNETLLTGWVDSYQPSYSATDHSVRLSGRSKTCDLVDCSVLVDGGQFRGLTVGEIARQLAKPFGVGVKVVHDGEPEAEVQVQQGETVFALVERLCRLQALLVTDDASGNLVLTRAGGGRASTALRHGQNILTASSNLDQSKRYSDVIVKAQRPGNSNKSDDDAPPSDYSDNWVPTNRQRLAEIEAIANPGERYFALRTYQRANANGSGRRGNPSSLTQIHGAIRDPEITRYRPLLIVAEAQSDDGLAETRADWEVRRRKGEGTKATINVNGFHQLNGSLWETNMLVQVEAPWLALNIELIISDVTYTYDENGEITQLGLTLPAAFLPDPKERKAKTAPAPSGGKPAAAPGWDATWKSTSGGAAP
jgi:prophage tail gpP-like protein